VAALRDGILEAPLEGVDGPEADVGLGQRLESDGFEKKARCRCEVTLGLEL